MNKQEIEYFLGEEIKTGLIDRITELTEVLNAAMAPVFIGKPKTNDNFDPKRGDSIAEEQDYIYESDLNQYEKAVFLYMHHTTYAQSTNDIAKACSISTASVKRVVSKAMKTGYIMRAPFEPGYILTKFA